MSTKKHEIFFKDVKNELDELKRYLAFYNSYLKKSSIKKNRGIHEEIMMQKKRLDDAFKNFIKSINGFEEDKK